VLTEIIKASTDDNSGVSPPCRILGRRQRFPNMMMDVEAFLGRWNLPSTERAEVRLRISGYGNVNAVGLPGIQEADDLDPSHPDWRAAIEDGVWPLVDMLTSGAWALVTYDSCQGHAYDMLELEPATRRVGILPRSAAEWTAVADALCRVLHVADPLMPPSVRLSLNRCELACGRTHTRYPVLDLDLDRAPEASWGSYFAALDHATDVLTAALRTQGPAPHVPCSCAAPSCGRSVIRTA
jgi:uncharacterized protein